MRELLLAKLSDLLGTSATELFEQILQNVTNGERNRLVATLGFCFLLFVATTLFVIIQNSLNQIWQVRLQRNSGRLAKIYKERLRSLGVLLVTGLLSLVAFAFDAGLAFFTDYIRPFDATFVYYLVMPRRAGPRDCHLLERLPLRHSGR